MDFLTSDERSNTATGFYSGRMDLFAVCVVIFDANDWCLSVAGA